MGYGYDDIIDLRNLNDDDEEEDDDGNVVVEGTRTKWLKALGEDGFDFVSMMDEEPIMIHERYFEDYAQQLAEEIGAISSDDGWPLNCIDWEQASDELKMDYSSVEVDGETYYFRSW